jgi:hypothetical protein
MIDQCQLQWHWGRGTGATAIARGHWGNRRQWQWGNGTVIIAIAIDRSCVCVDVGRGARAWACFIPCVLIQNVSECPKGGPIKGVTYLVDYFD